MTAQLSDYLLRLPPTSAPVVSDSQDTVGVSSFGSELRQAGLWWRCGALLATHLAGSACWLGSWICLGSSALRGRWDSGWLAAWGLALAATVPLRFTTTWLEGVLTVGCGGLLRQRLFAGALRMETEVIRRQGPGALLSEILEAEAIDTVGVRAAVRCLLGALELLLASLLLAWTAGGEAQAWVLGGCVALLLLVAWRHLHQRAAWSRLRLSLTHHLVENMTAHRTRIAQQAPAEWHRSEDEELERYGAASLAPDRTLAFLEAGLPRLYLVLALSVLALRLLGPESSGQGLALQLGSVLFAALALERVCATLARGAAAWVAWRAARPMFDASGAPPAAPASPDAIAATGKALEVGNLCFTHRGRSEAALGGCSFAVERGTRTLIQGTSGSGKSTLAALLGGLREPSAGFVLAGGVDRFTLGPSAWRRRVAVAPQQHENHVLSASLAFNLLLARPFPHTAEDHADAAELCAELGLSPLLARMPAGLQQIVGETGWRLSQGERSRVFLARALLQNAEVVVLDESFAGLDPESLRQCLDCAARRARTLIVIAHP